MKRATRAGMTTWVVTFFILMGGVVKADVSDFGAGARAAGMAEAFVAVADDATGPFYNPAGMTQLNQREISTHYTQLLKGLSDASQIESSFIGYVQPLKTGRHGVLGVAVQNFKGANSFTDRSINVSYAWKFAPLAFGWRGQWSGGVNLKQFNRTYKLDQFAGNSLDNNGDVSGQADPLFKNHGTSKNTTSMDAGALYRFGNQNKWNFGISFANLNRPDSSLGRDEDYLPLIARGGLAYRANWGLLSTEVRRSKRFSNATDSEMAVGIERKIFMGKSGGLHFRGGYAQGSRQFQSVTAGFSFDFGNMKMDYAFGFPLGAFSATQGSHRVGFSFRLGPNGWTKETHGDLTKHELPQSGALNPAVAYYFQRKNEGAPVYERLDLIQKIYTRYGQDNAVLSFVAKELSSF